MNERGFININLSNSSGSKKYVWIELAGYMIEPEPKYEFLLQSREDSYHIEYVSETQFNIFFEGIQFPAV